MPGPTRAVLESLVHQPFDVWPPQGEGRTRLTLSSIEPLGGAKHPESFRLLFRGERSSALGQGLYFFEHAQLPREAVFIVPVERDDATVTYEAVFNRG
jgi:hypothetical protein